MKRNYRIFIKVTKEQKVQLFSKAERLGFPNLTLYMLWCANCEIREDLQEIKLLLKKNG
jgi:DUF438 domain-containing protein